MSVDLDALRAEVQMAQQSNRKMCMIPTNDLVSLLMRARELEKVQSMVPFKVGYVYPEDVHRMMQGELHRVGLSRKKGNKYRVEVRVQALPSSQEDRNLVLDLERLVEQSMA